MPDNRIMALYLYKGEIEIHFNNSITVLTSGAFALVTEINTDPLILQAVQKSEVALVYLRL